MASSLIKAVIFDFDGLMLDTELPSFQVWQEIFAQHGAVLEREIWVQCVGASYDHFHPCTHLEKLTGKTVNYKELVDLKNQLKSDICDKLPFMPGVIEKLDEVKELSLKMAIASSSSNIWIERHLDMRKVRDEFDAIATGNEVKQTKPMPDVYLLAAKKLGLDPKYCLAFEDSRNGVLAAKAAGMTVVAVPNSITEASDFSKADLKLKSLNEMTIGEILGQV